MNFDKIYDYRFKDVDNNKKKLLWKEISHFLYKKLNKPVRVIDPAGGMCEFINSFPAEEKWVVDINEAFLLKHADNNINKIIGNSLEVELPENYFDLVFISNFLEHLKSQDEVHFFLTRMYKSLRKGGKIVIIGPNFKYSVKTYFDFADHTVILTELAVAEHLAGANFNLKEITGRFLPFSFKSKLPSNSFLAKTYLSLPFIWPFFGKQFLLIGEK